MTEQNLDNVIFLGDETYYLVRPKGRAGRRFISTVQEALRVVTPAMGVSEDDERGIDTMIRVTNRLFEDDALQFESLILPGMLKYTTSGPSDEKVEEILDGIEDPPMKIMMEFINAANFWLGMAGYNREEMLEALKKSKGAKKAEA